MFLQPSYSFAQEELPPLPPLPPLSNVEPAPNLQLAPVSQVPAPPAGSEDVLLPAANDMLILDQPKTATVPVIVEPEQDDGFTMPDFGFFNSDDEVDNPVATVAPAPEALPLQELPPENTVQSLDVPTLLTSDGELIEQPDEFGLDFPEVAEDISDDDPNLSDPVTEADAEMLLMQQGAAAVNEEREEDLQQGDATNLTIDQGVTPIPLREEAQEIPVIPPLDQPGGFNDADALTSDLPDFPQNNDMASELDELPTDLGDLPEIPALPVLDSANENALQELPELEAELEAVEIEATPSELDDSDEMPDFDIDPDLSDIIDQQMLLGNDPSETTVDEDGNVSLDGFDLPEPPNKNRANAPQQRKYVEWPDNFKTQILPQQIYKKDYRAENRHLPTAITQNDIHSQIFKAAAESDLDGVRALLRSGIPLTVRNQTGSTLLIHAAQMGSQASVEMLLGLGLQPNITDPYGTTALHRAVYGGHANIVKILLRAGANPYVGDVEGLTPVTLAKMRNDQQMLTLLARY